MVRPEPPARTVVRPEIQALRAIAVGAVLVYHLSPRTLPGGFVGVDVFFVISGFLITSHLLREADRTGRISLRGFWSGRVRRILPAALVTTVAIVVAAGLLTSRLAAARVGEAAIWAAASAANWFFAAQSVDYQAQAPDASPFEHYWSLGVEEQFYLLWPFVLLAAVALARRFGRLGRIAPIALVLAASLTFGVAFTATGSQAAYFVTPTRMWELAAGGLLAVLVGDRGLRIALALPLQIAGLAAIVWATITFGSDTPMPGLAAMLPVSGAVAFVAGGDVPVLGRVWRLPPIRFVGDVSYSLYLWHWPLFVFWRLVYGDEPPGPLVVVALVAASLALATTSYLVVEQPARRWRRPAATPLRTILAGVVATALVAGVAVIPIGVEANASASSARAEQRVNEQPTVALGYASLVPAANRTWATTPHVPVPDPASVVNDVAFGHCTIEAQSVTDPVCTVGDRTSTRTIALVGDSHAFQWLGALDLLGKAHGWRIITFVHNSCPFSLVPRQFELDGHSRCTESVRHALETLRSDQPRVVITSAYRFSYPGRIETAAAGYDAMWALLRGMGADVVVLGDTPAPPTSPTIPECVSGPDPASCGISRAAAVATPDPLRAAADRDPNAAFVDPTDAFCGTDRCPGVIGNVVVYRDSTHVSNTYMKSALPWLEVHLAPLIERDLAAAPAT